jgi:hypothetical protein
MPLLPGDHNNSGPAGGSSEACLRGSRDSMIEASSAVTLEGRS